MDDAIIAQWGGFGAIFVVIVGGLSLEYRRLRIKFDEVQAARVADAREVIASTKEATKDFSEMLTEKDDRDGDTKLILSNIEHTLERVEERLGHIEDQLPKRRAR